MRVLCRRIAAAIVVLVCFLAGPALADDALRPLTTDRPDLTESPFTVNAGHVQIESTLVGYAQSRSDADGIEERSFEFATTNVRLGLTANTELNVSWRPYGLVRFRSNPGPRPDDLEGIGSVDIRGKLNLYGNDTFDAVGDTALALLLFVTLPTDEDGISVGHVEGGLIVPFAVVLPLGFGLGLNAGAFAVKSEDDDDYRAEVFLSAALAYEWSARFGTYTEVAATLNTQDPRGEDVLLGTGFTYALDDNTQLDGGVYLGLTDASDRWAPFLGFTRRF